MYWDLQMTPEEEEEFIRKIAQKIHDYGLEAPAILMLETFKPLNYIGAQMSRFMVQPFLPALGDSVGVAGEKMIRIFEKRENLEKIMNLVEELAREDRKKKKAEAALKPPKKGWRRFIPF